MVDLTRYIPFVHALAAAAVCLYLVARSCWDMAELPASSPTPAAPPTPSVPSGPESYPQPFVPGTPGGTPDVAPEDFELCSMHFGEDVVPLSEPAEDKVGLFLVGCGGVRWGV